MPQNGIKNIGSNRDEYLILIYFPSLDYISFI